MRLNSEVKYLKERATKFYNDADYEKSLKVVNEVLHFKKSDEESHFLKANILHLQGKIGAAIQSFKKVLQLNPDNTDAMISLSVLYNDIGKYSEAQSFFNRANNKVKQGTNGVVDNHINKKFAGLHFEIAEMYFAYGRFDEALKEYQKASILNPLDFDSKIKIAKTYDKKGFHSKSLEQLLKLKSETPNSVPVRLALGIHFYSRGKVIEAQNEWKNILNREPRNKEARMYLTLSQSATEVSL